MSEQTGRTIDVLRKDIDDIDAAILELLNRRAVSAIEIARLKRDGRLKFYSPERERAIFERLRVLNAGPFPNDALKIIFREIMSASLSLEEPLRVSYLGPGGTFTHLAALRHFGSSASFMPVENIRDIFDVVDRGNADFGLVPIENSNEGVVSYTLDMFVDYDLKIAAEVMLEVSHNLLSKSGLREKVRKIFSHPQAVAQCRGWLDTNMKGIPVFESTSTARAAELTSTDDEAAAIASELASRLYDLRFVQRRIEDNRNNFTRFLVIAREDTPRTGSDKTSVMFSLKDKPGALYSVLAPFKKAGVNLTKIESRPSKRKAWEYIFFADMIGHIEDSGIRRAIDAVKDHCIYLKHLGSYPAGENIKR